MTELEAMRRALELALKGWGRVAPNPLVGAVLLRDGQVVGEGYHAEFGGAHAEVAALDDCDDPAGTTCVVTLEPCAHAGKTPPCTEALRAAGVGRVVAAVRDPTAAGGGLERLREAGVDVAHGVAAGEAAALNAPFLFNACEAARPFVAVKVATSLDGFMADATGHSQWISGPGAREFVHWLRAGFDAIGVGRKTAVLDDPELTVRGPVTPRRPPVRVVFAGAGELPAELRLFEAAAAPTTVVAGPGRAVELRQAFAHTQVTVLEASDLPQGLRGLREAGVESLLVEGGAALVRALLDGALVDRLYWVQAPIWLGQGVTPFGPGGAVPLDEAQAWTVTERRALGPDTLLVVDRELCLQVS